MKKKRRRRRKESEVFLFRSTFSPTSSRLAHVVRRKKSETNLCAFLFLFLFLFLRFQPHARKSRNSSKRRKQLKWRGKGRN